MSANRIKNQQSEFEAWLRSKHKRMSLDRVESASNCYGVSFDRTYQDDRTEQLWCAWRMAWRLGDRCFSGCAREPSLSLQESVLAESSRVLSHFRSLARMFESNAAQDNTEVGLTWSAAAEAIMRVHAGLQRGCLEID